MLWSALERLFFGPLSMLLWHGVGCRLGILTLQGLRVLLGVCQLCAALTVTPLSASSWDGMAQLAAYCYVRGLPAWFRHSLHLAECQAAAAACTHESMVVGSSCCRVVLVPSWCFYGPLMFCAGACLHGSYSEWASWSSGHHVAGR